MRTLRRIFGKFKQALCFIVRELEFVFEQCLDGAAFMRVERVVHPRGFDQKHGDGDLKIVTACRRALGRREKLADSIDDWSDHS
jgi:hypothetical protein